MAMFMVMQMQVYVRPYLLTRGYDAVAHTEHYRNEHVQRYRQTLLDNITLHHNMLSCYIISCYVTLSCVILYYVTSYNIIMYHTVLYFIISNCFVLYHISKMMKI